MTTAKQVKQLVEGQEDVLRQTEDVASLLQDQTGIVEDRARELLDESLMTQEGMRLALARLDQTHVDTDLLSMDHDEILREIAAIKAQQVLTNKLLAALLFKDATIVAIG